MNLLPLVLLGTTPCYSAETERFYLYGVEDKSIYAVLEPGKNGKKVLNISGVKLKPKSQIYIESIEDNLSGSLCPDRTRLLVSLSHIEEKNVWVLNLNTSKIEFTSHDNPARHVFLKWLTPNTFELMYGGMGYRVERKYRLENQSWKMVRDKTIQE